MINDVTGIILAGGRGRRFSGEDKGLLRLDNKPLIQHVIEKLEPQVSEIIISANRNIDRYKMFNHAVVSDDHDTYLGPLSGLASALSKIKTPLALLVPCDMPLLAPDLCRSLYDALTGQKCDVAIAHDGERLQPLCTLLKRNLLDELNMSLKTNHLKAQTWLTEHNHCIVDLSNESGSFFNINTPDDLLKINTKELTP